MKIVAVRRCRGHQVAVLTDDGNETLLDKRTYEESPYGVDSFLSCEEWDALCEKSAQDRMREKAVFLLSKRDYSRRELERKLCREKGQFHRERCEGAAEAASYMEQLGYVNDVSYAARLAEQYHTVRLYPRRRIVEKLCEKGIEREVAKEAVNALCGDDAQLALEFLRKKRYTVPMTTEETEKQAAALARYGFSGEDIRRAMRWRQEEENE